MKSLSLLFLCSFSTLFLVAQAPTDPASLWEEFRKNHETTTKSQFLDDVMVLDSTHIWRQGEQDFYLLSKHHYEYNNQGIETKSAAYRFDQATSQFFQASETNRIITPFDKYFIFVQSTADTGPIVNSERYTYTTNPNDEDAVIDSRVDTWSENEQDWMPYSEQIQVSKTEEKRIREFYRWEESEAAYKLKEKYVLDWYDEKNIQHERFNYDDQTMKYIPNRQTIIEYNSDGIVELYAISDWDETLNDWVLFLKFEYFYDLPDHPDYGLIYYDLSNDGQLDLTDSCVFILNEEHRYLRDSLFTYDEVAEDFQLTTVNVYNRLSNGYLDNIEIFTIVDNECVLTSRTDYFYSTISTTTDISQPAFAPFGLSFENPSQQIRLQLEGAEELGEISFTLYDLNGQLLDRTKVIGNTSIRLGEEDLVPGVYVILASLDQQKFHWKVMVH